MNENKIYLRGISSSVDQAVFLVMTLILAKNVLLVIFASARQFHKLQIDANLFPCSLKISRSNGFFPVSFFFLLFWNLLQWLWNPGQISLGVEDRGISEPTKSTNVPKKINESNPTYMATASKLSNQTTSHYYVLRVYRSGHCFFNSIT